MTTYNARHLRVMSSELIADAASMWGSGTITECFPM
jgi:hypothetical protein